MYSLVYGHDLAVAKWVQAQLWGHPNFGPCTAIGVAKDDELIAGVVYHDYHDTCIQMSCASIDRRWLSKERLAVFFGYPFLQLGVDRIATVVAKNNKRARRLNEGLGFRLEGVHRRAWNGKDAVSYGMLADECRWLNGILQRRAESACCA